MNRQIYVAINAVFLMYNGIIIATKKYFLLHISSFTFSSNLYLFYQPLYLFSIVNYSAIAYTKSIYYAKIYI